MENKNLNSTHCFLYDETDIEFIKQNIDLLSYKAMADYFSEKYNRRFSGDSISHLARRNGIRKTTRVYKDRKNNRCKAKYSREMLDFLKDAYSPQLGWDGLTNLFNSRFSVNYTMNEIRGACRRKYGFKMNNNTTFNRENHSRALPIGAERIGSGGRLCVKISNKYSKGDSTVNWKTKSRVVWESHYGPIPDGHVIIHLNGDLDDFDINNLCCIDKGISACLMRERWHGKGEITLSGIKYAELIRKIKEGEISYGE